MGVANAPSSLARSSDRVHPHHRPPSASCTEAATINTCTSRRAYWRPHAQVDPAKLMTPLLSALRVTVNPTVASLARRWVVRIPGSVSSWGVNRKTLRGWVKQVGSKPPPDRGRSLCAASPIPASNGKTNRHRLNLPTAAGTPTAPST